MSSLQNRVFPDGTIRRDPARGLFLGNRGGRMHDAHRQLVRTHASRQWIICVLEFKGRHRQVMGDGYTELFFMDEPTALAAGHRPCFECRRAAAMDYAIRFPGEGRSRAPHMDRVLHGQRMAPCAHGPATDLPDGAMFKTGDDIFCVRAGRALVWSPTGYGAPGPLPQGGVEVLTPAATLATLSAGYRSVFHPSADA